AEGRAPLVARLGNLISGHAGVGPELCQFLVDRVNDGFVPAVPRRGVGCAGAGSPTSSAPDHGPGTGLAPLAACLEGLVAPVDRDRPARPRPGPAGGGPGTRRAAPALTRRAARRGAPGLRAP